MKILIIAVYGDCAKNKAKINFVIKININLEIIYVYIL